MEELHISYFLLPVFFLVALFFSSVGHGGASGYLAIFALAGVARTEIAPVVLIMNMIVALNSLFNYWRAKYFSTKLLIPFVISSIPASFVGGLFKLSTNLFSALLGTVLLLVGIWLLFYKEQINSRLKGFLGKPFLYAIPIGILIGLVSGMSGIGGAVFLSPILLMTNWADSKQTAAVASAFVTLNSAAALIAKSFHTVIHWDVALILGIVVLLGGQIGAYYGANRVQHKFLQKILGIALLLASLKLLNDLIF